MTPNASQTSPSLSAGARTALRIEVAAVDLVLENGIDGTTVDAICKAAGVSERTFFYHFPTKESAIIGTSFPKIDEQKARQFLAAPAGDIFSDALDLIPLNTGLPAQSNLMFKRLQMMQKNTGLFASHLSKLMAVRGEHMELIYLRLRRNAPAEMPDNEVRDAAEFISEIAASFVRSEMEKMMGNQEPSAQSRLKNVGATLAHWVEVGRNS